MIKFETHEQLTEFAKGVLTDFFDEQPYIGDDFVENIYAQDIEFKLIREDGLTPHYGAEIDGIVFHVYYYKNVFIRSVSILPEENHKLKDCAKSVYFLKSSITLAFQEMIDFELEE
ncbi:hypothetical protein [Bacillus nitratireducens]|uniref:hypothetical protein n=1 Tax=Bacillus nitratireducens TaxID=2026193 RepID=UPI00089C7F87|nr:hypothetical protein [Bacillus nitratireducens]SDZ85446.1 hypothetical protein SAMN04488146_101320 [Bacillus nitratireducens]